MSGCLYGVGVGPGAADLVTLRAARLIERAAVIAYPALAGGESLARGIVAALIPTGAEEIVIDVPMTVARGPAQAAYDKGAARIAAVLGAGRDVVCLCEGDPFFYGSFMYLFARLRGRFAVEIVPGVTSLSACTAAAALPLVARNERLLVLPGPLPSAELADLIGRAEAVAILKVGRHLERVRDVIADLGLLDAATYVARASLAAQVVMPLAEAPVAAPYFSMILVNRGNDPWL